MVHKVSHRCVCGRNSSYLRTRCVDMETIRSNSLCFPGAYLCGCRVELLCGRCGEGPARAGARASSGPAQANVGSRAAYAGPVGGTMVLAGVRGVASPGRESGPTE